MGKYVKLPDGLTGVKTVTVRVSMLFLVIFQLHRRKVRAASSVKFIVTRILIIFYAP
jgi:hypothetical protein